MLKRVERINAPIGRVKCGVSSCKYYARGDLCMARDIRIMSAEVLDYKYACCATFVKK